METALIKVFSFICIIGLGFCISRSGKVPAGLGMSLSKLIFTVTLPCAIIHAFGTSEFNAALIMLTGVGIATTVLPYLIGLAVSWRRERGERVLMLMNISGYNIGCFALPFVQALFPGGAAPLIVCLYDAGNALMMSGGSFAFTSALLEKGTPLLTRVQHALQKLFSSVPFDLYLILIALSLVGLRIPEPVVQFVEPVAQANSFLAMFMLGLLMHFSLDGSKVKQLMRLLGLRFFLCFAMSAAVYLWLPADHVTRVVVAALLWAPMGSLGPVYTMWGKGDGGLAGLANAITIGVAIVAMTVIAMLFG